MKKMNLEKRIASLAMVMVMLLSYIPGTVWAVDSSTDIKAIEKPIGLSIVEDYDDYFGDGWEDKLGLPVSVTVTLANNTTAEAPVTWDTSALDTREPGYYYLPGNVTLPVGTTNGQNIDVSITIQVREKANLIPGGGMNSGSASAVRDNMYIAGTHSQVQSPVKEGSHSAKTYTTWNAWGNVATSKNLQTVAAAVQVQGAGQYYFGIWAQSENAEIMKITPKITYKNPANTSGKTISGSQVALSNTEFVQISGVTELPGDVTSVEILMRLDRYSDSVSLNNQVLYLDELELIPLNVPLQAEPSAVAEIKTEVLSRFVEVNYQNYVGENWQTALGLPKTVEVVTDKGDTAALNVTWDYSKLDLTTCGKYTLTGTLDSSAYPNPKGLTVQQSIYVREGKNLLPAGGFNSPSPSVVKADFYIAGTHSQVGSPVKEGSYAAKTYTTWNAWGNIASTYNQQAVAAAVQEQGAGQYYFGIWAQSENADTMKLTSMITYKNPDKPDGKTISASQVALSSTEFVSASGVAELPGDVTAVQVVIRLDRHSESISLNNQILYLDLMQLLPINITIPKGQEPADMVEVMTEIPVRAVVENYDAYVGAGWKESLGLPASVEVRTGNGNIASVNVAWDFTALDLTKEGKYTLVGTLDSSAYPNPDNLTVQQIIYIRKSKNLISGGGMNSDSASTVRNSIYIAGTHSQVESPVKEGSHAAKTYTTWNAWGNVASTYNQQTVAEAVQAQGEGQYYFGIWAQSENAETMKLTPMVTYKNPDKPDGKTTSAAQVALSNTKFVSASGVADLPGDVTSVQVVIRLDRYSENGSLNNQVVYLDQLELIPLNVIVKTYEGAMKEVETIIPDRNIILNYPSYIGEGYTEADLMLPETVDVRSTNGENVSVEVKWNLSNLNLNKLGTYTLIGTLDAMKLANPNALTVSQVIHVVNYQNLLSNPSFEDGAGFWSPNRVKTISAATPVKDGSVSLKMTVESLEGYSSSIYKDTWLQPILSKVPDTLGLRVLSTGAGRYFFGSWVHGTKDSTDMRFATLFRYYNISRGDSLVTMTAPEIKLSSTQFLQSGGLVDVPDDIYWARMDIYFYGTVEQMRMSTMYLDHAELIPLNVEVPKMNDIIDCEEPADVYASAGTSFEGLHIPDSLEIQIKTGQRFNISVTWDKSQYDPNKIGTQTINGTLNLSGKYVNSKGFAPTVKVIIRAKGEDLRQTIYISTSGSEDNDGLSPNSPKKEVQNIATYLKQGYNVKLKRGDSWYLPTGSITLKDIHGTEDAPLVIGAYGSGDALPAIGFMMKIENGAWKLVDEKRNVYAADVSSLGQQYGISVHRCFVNDEAYFHKNRTNYVALDAGEYCSYDGTLYVRMPVGEAPNRVEVTQYGGGKRLNIEDVSYLTIEYIHFKGASTKNRMISVEAPTKYLKFQYCSMTHCFYYIMVFEASDDRIHYKPEVSHCFIDAMFNEKEGTAIDEGGDWQMGLTEGIVMRDGVDGGWIHNNHIRNMGHAFITIETLDTGVEPKITGVRNCIIEDNLLEGGNAGFARAFNICGGFNSAGIQMCRDNIYRRNRCYDMTVSSHLYGENNLVYSNVISYVHTGYDEEGVQIDGKNPQPFGFDIDPWGEMTCNGNMVINNTFYNVGSAIAFYDQANAADNNIVANNLIVNWTSDSDAVRGITGAIYDNSVGVQYVMNNGVYASGQIDHFVVDNKIYQAADANTSVIGYSGNISADPKFVNADLSQMDKGARLDFTLSNESPMRYAGLSINASVYKNFPAWERLKAEYTDLNGTLYLAESPSIGAISYSEKIKGEVASISKLEDIVARTGAELSQLFLPDTVTAENDQGIDVVLLIDWNVEGFDSSKPGTVVLTGTLRNGPHTELNVTGKTVSINVQIKDKLELVSITSQVKGFTVLYNTSLEGVIAQLPRTLAVVTETGFEEELPVTWSCEDYNPTVPDVYSFKCILPADLITNPEEFDIEVDIRVLHEIGRGMELLVNPDFIDGTSAGPWKFGWGTGSFKVTQDPEYLPEGEPAAAIVTAEGKYGSIQQDVTGQVKLMGDGQYLFRIYMRSYLPLEPIISSTPCIQVLSSRTYMRTARTQVDIGEEWVEYTAIMKLYNVDEATEIMFHTSTYKDEEDVGENPKSYIIAGCSLIYLGNTDSEVEATLDSIGLTWNTIKGDNGHDTENVTSDLTLPSTIGEASQIVWSSSDESAITSGGKVTMGRLPKRVVLTADITHKNGIVTTKKFTVTVPRNPDLPIYTASLSCDQTTVKPGEEFQVVISVNSENATAYNAYRFTLSFTKSKLEFVGISDSNSTVEVDGGRLVISGIGTERPITDTITVTFRALKSGVTDVKLVLLEMDLDPNASMETLPVMTVTNETVTIDVEKIQKDDNDDEGDQIIDAEPAKDNTAIWYILAGVAGAILICGGAIVWILVTKRKQTPPADE